MQLQTHPALSALVAREREADIVRAAARRQLVRAALAARESRPTGIRRTPARRVAGLWSTLTDGFARAAGRTSTAPFRPENNALAACCA